MTQVKNLIAGLVVTATVALAPLANAQTVHVVGAGSSAQFNTAAIGADALAISKIAADGHTGSKCAFHWTQTNGAQVVDNRDARINPELGNIWVVWIGDCSDISGASGITDVWTDVSVDSTVGVRTFYAQQTTGSGAQVQILSANGTAGSNRIKPPSLWPDNNSDVALNSTISGAIGTTTTNGVHINVGLTDIRPEDAYFATTRALGTLNTSTYSGLGYKGVTANIGAGINTSQGTGTQAIPVKFVLSGGSDPITHQATRTSTTIPVGAAPIVFAYNNGTLTPTSVPTDLKTGITPGKHVASQAYPLANLFDGTTACKLSNPAFDAFSGAPQTANVNLVLREPLSGTMNTTEFNLFRSFGNTTDSQEKGIISPLSAPYNPLNLACAGGGGKRTRAIGTGEVVNAVKTQNNALGYFFWSFANGASLTGAQFNYLTLDGIDPLFSTPGGYNTCVGGTNPGNICQTSADCTGGGTCSGSPAGPQALPTCTNTNCPATLWPGSNSYPNLRNGTYKAWSLLRWITETDEAGEVDQYGPAHLADFMQAAINTSIADFVPFHTASDGLSIYRSHFKQTVIPAETAANNGALVGNSLGGETEKGGDMGGLVMGPFPATGNVKVTVVSGVHHATYIANSGQPFSTWAATTSANGNTVTINGQACTISGSVTTSFIFTGCSQGVATSVPYSYGVQTPGVLLKKQ